MSSAIWVPHPEQAWIPATVISDKGANIIVRIRGSGSDSSLPGPLSKYDIVAESSLNEECDNLVDLESYSEGIILHHIRTRFLSGKIYTFVGNILVAVNPYKALDIYGVKIMEDAFVSVRKSESRVKPHVFSIAAMALSGMREERKNQCVLISGESGAGKTETTKKILQFVSTMALSSSSRGSISVESQILDSNPILESFGNAKTIRNNNSSRFGKYMEINFDKKFCIKGCNITSYLLEKTRVVRVGTLERNYHIFYMLVAGASIEQKKEFNLKSADQFNYLTQGECITIENRNDSQEYMDVVKAMNNLGFDHVFQHNIFQSLAGILHLGDLQFSPKGDDGSSISSSNDCKQVAKYLGFPNPELLESTLCFRENIVNKEVFMIPLNPTKAKDQRDALAKYIYSRIFDVIVNYVNTSLFRGKINDSNIGILDIFGFEVFYENSFEQLCINYCNERLQTFFNEIIFEGEMKMYVSDGVNCDDISFQDNIECVRLIDLKGVGIFPLLDEQVILPGGSDEKFIQKLNQVFDENPTSKSQFYVRNRRKPKEFGIFHFAGEVNYTVTNFLEKNKDALATGLVKLINQSSISFIHSEVDTSFERPEGSTTLPISPSGKVSTRATLSSKFKQDLDNLMTNLRITTPFFVRCIKPNIYQAANQFDSPLTLNQLKYSGLFEAVSIRKAGYAIRMLHKQFIERYKHCVDFSILPKDLIKSNPKQSCQILMESMLVLISQNVSRKSIRGSSGLAPGQGAKPPPPPLQGFKPPPPPSSASKINLQTWCVGNTRLYIRNQELKVQLDKLRVSQGAKLVIHIQRVVRGYLSRRATQRRFGINNAQKMLDKKRSDYERTLMAKEDKSSLENEIIFRNDVELQHRIYEAKRQRVRAENLRKMKIAINAAVVIQRIFRGKIGRAKGRRMLVEKAFRKALESQEHGAINRALELQAKLKVSSKAIQAYIRHAKSLVLNMFNETYVIEQLEEAIKAGVVVLLQAAIDLAQANNMTYLPAYQDAQAALHECIEKRQVLVYLEHELNAADTVPILVSRKDVIQSYIHNSLRLGLASSEPIVHEAALRLSKITNLIKTRDDLRQAVELCSETRIIKGLSERDKLCKIYGQDLFSEEATALHGMLRMLAFDKQVAAQYQIDKVLSQKDNSSKQRSQDEDDEEDEEDSNNGDEDIKLPSFVREVLDLGLRATTNYEIQDAEQAFELIVPLPNKRRIYRRVFKWVVAHATWRYKRVTENEPGPSVMNADKSMVSMSSSTNGKLNKSSSVLNSTSMLNTSSKNNTMPVSLNKSKLSKSQSGTLTPPSKVKAARTTLVSNKTKDVFTLLDDVLTSRGLKAGNNHASSLRRSPEHTSKQTLAMTGSAVGIPYTERQSKSDVAAYEALKAGAKSEFSADRMIDDAVAELQSFYGKQKFNPHRWR